MSIRKRTISRRDVLRRRPASAPGLASHGGRGRRVRARSGWRAGAGYQPGEPNFAAIEAWNAAGVYQKAIALMGRQIDGGQ